MIMMDRAVTLPVTVSHCPQVGTATVINWTAPLYTISCIVPAVLNTRCVKRMTFHC